MDAFKKRGEERSGIPPLRRRVALDDSFHDLYRPIAELCQSPYFCLSKSQRSRMALE